MAHIMDRLFDDVQRKGHCCVGLDTDYSYLPEDFAGGYTDPAEAIEAFNKRIVDATLDAAGCYKVQIAYYEALGLKGLKAYANTLRYVREKGAVVIADVKRGDIAKTAEMYARAHFTGDFEADIITVSPFMGMDTLEPFFPYLKDGQKGLFALVATSNPGAKDIEGILAADGESVSEKTGKMIRETGAQFAGDHGYNAIGAVVGCTNKAQTKRIRERLGGVFFLIPGYGAQGGKAEDLADYMVGGNGGVVNSSRGILLARNKEQFQGMAFDEAARAETIQMRDAIRNAV